LFYSQEIHTFAFNNRLLIYQKPCFAVGNLKQPFLESAWHSLVVRLARTPNNQPLPINTRSLLSNNLPLLMNTRSLLINNLPLLHLTVYQP